MRRHRETADGLVAGADWSGEVVEDTGWDEFDPRKMLALHPSGVEEGEELTREQLQRWSTTTPPAWGSR